jgi:hypothetical protein
MQTSDCTTIAESKLGTIPYMEVWALFLALHRSGVPSEPSMTTSGKAMVSRAREVGQCVTALPITLGAKEYRTYLAAWTRSTNLINNDLIETLRLNASLFVEPKTRMLTTVGTEIPCGDHFSTDTRISTVDDQDQFYLAVGNDPPRRSRINRSLG